MQMFYIRKAGTFPYQYYYERRDGMCIFGTDLNKARLFQTPYKAIRFIKRKLSEWLHPLDFKIDAVEIKVSNL